MKYNEIKTPEDLLKFMEENITYGFVSKNNKIYDDPNSEEWNNDWYHECIVQDGGCLLETKYGTCWDQVELERKWFSENNYNFKTIFLWFEVNKPNNLPTHTFLIYEKNNKYYWFEHAYFNYKGIHEFNSEEQLIEYVKDKQLEYAIETNRATLEDKKYITYYEYDKPLKNLNVDDYISHVTSNNCKIKN